MRHPLDWLVVSISLLVLFANRMLVEKPPAEMLVPRVQAAPTSPFAWVREDGSQEFLPITGEAAEDLHANSGFAAPRLQADPAAAVYTWSSTVIEK